MVTSFCCAKRIHRKKTTLHHYVNPTGGYEMIDRILSPMTRKAEGAGGRVPRKALTLLLDLVQLAEKAPALVAGHQGDIQGGLG